MGRIPSEMRTIPERIGDAQQADTGLLAEFFATTGPEDIFRPQSTLQASRKRSLSFTIRRKKSVTALPATPSLKSALVQRATTAGKQYLAIRSHNEAPTFIPRTNDASDMKLSSQQTKSQNELHPGASVGTTLKLNPRKLVNKISKAPLDLYVDTPAPHIPIDSLQKAESQSPILTCSKSTSTSSNRKESLVCDTSLYDSENRKKDNLRVSWDPDTYDQSRSSSCETYSRNSSMGSLGSRGRADRTSYGSESTRSEISLEQSLSMLRGLSEDFERQNCIEVRASSGIPHARIKRDPQPNGYITNRSSASSFETPAATMPLSISSRLRTAAALQSRLSKDSLSSLEFDAGPMTPIYRVSSGNADEFSMPFLHASNLPPVFEKDVSPLSAAKPHQTSCANRATYSESVVQDLEQRNQDLEEALSHLLSARTAHDKDQHLRDLLAR